MLTGTYARQAAKSYKTPEAKQLLDAVRQAIRLIDEAMKGPPTPERGKRIAHVTSALELSADRFDLFGEKRKKV